MHCNFSSNLWFRQSCWWERTGHDRFRRETNWKLSFALLISFLLYGFSSLHSTLLGLFHGSSFYDSHAMIRLRSIIKELFKGILLIFSFELLYLLRFRYSKNWCQKQRSSCDQIYVISYKILRNYDCPTFIFITWMRTRDTTCVR